MIQQLVKVLIDQALIYLKHSIIDFLYPIVDQITQYLTILT